MKKIIILSFLLAGIICLGTPLYYAVMVDTNNLIVYPEDGLILTTGTPASASATGSTGQIVWDSSYIYVCVATDTWKRAPISTW